MRQAALVVGVVTLLAQWLPAPEAADIHLSLDNNLTVLLHDDHTWTPSDPKARGDLVEMTITLEDGQDVHLSADGTWSFVVDESNAAEEGFTNIYHTGRATATDALEAGKLAEKLAVDGLVKRLKAVVGAGVPAGDLAACVQDIDKEVLRQERKEGEQYRVLIRLTLDKVAIDAVQECIQLSSRIRERAAEEDEKEPASDSD
jgi:hypothetical protein